ncbi:apolipoprotein N-acyltransferase [Methylomonas sp. SURF-2]|uniref:Apolipoprotein N-acyltransferase n=1 Tax=Methylomonas subterranea TaxID=2952225 RepID=A0ABT1TJL8_9GAMM|nr:apolipoprotein N-acyltransferase [Methylomonas sp. SURF-2]MCQ8105653.1 apolipoprotein N-acyltransferase [Methylomonas sp. SURF-2]
MTRLVHWKWQLLAPACGVLLTFSFAPYDYSYFALPALAFFYRLCIAPARHAALSGYLFGLGLFGSGIWWVYISIHRFGGADPYSAGLLTLLLVAVWALFPALTAYLSAKLLAMAGVWFRILAVGLTWVAVEYLRGYWLLNGFPWLQIAYGQLNTPLAGYAPLVGVYGAGFLLAVSAALCAEMWRVRRLRLSGLLALCAIWGGGCLLRQVQWTHAVGAPIKVALLQGNIAQDQKWLEDQRQHTLSLYWQLTQQHWDADVIVWPETAIPVFLSQVKDFYLEPLSALARENGTDLLVSLPSEGEGKSYYNSVMSLGAREALYHKHHLLPFGEYLPLQPLSGWVLDRLAIPLGNFAAGAAEQPLLEAGGYPLVTTICYEDAFGELVSRQVGRAAYLVNVTNDAWFGDTSQPHQHMQIAQMRALETGRYLLRATNTGLSGIVMPNGKISARAPLFTTTALTGTIIPMAGLTPYARWGDSAVFAGLFLLVGMVWRLSKFQPGGWRRNELDGSL